MDIFKKKKFKEKLVKRQHGFGSNVYSLTVQSSKRILIQFLGEKGVHTLAPRLLDFPLQVWHNFILLQHTIDHNITCYIGNGDTWDISDDHSNWSVTLIYETNLRFKLNIREHTGTSVIHPKFISLTPREWIYLKDCMIPTISPSLENLKLGIYVMRDLVREVLDKLVTDHCPGCQLANTQVKVYSIQHTCMIDRGYKEETFFEQAVESVDSLAFTDSVRRTARKRGMNDIGSTYMLHHIILRFHICIVKQLLIEPKGLFNNVQGKMY